MNTWIVGKDLIKRLLQIKKAFYSKLCLEEITDEDYIRAQKVFEEFKLKNQGEYHNLYVQSDTLLLADVFENFRNKYIELYELYPDPCICTWNTMGPWTKDESRFRVINMSCII